MTKTASTVLLPRLLIGMVLLTAGLAGCDGGSSASPNASASASANRQQLLALGQQWVQCLRSHGLTRMPDAQLTQDGYLQFTPAGGYNWKEDLGKRRSIIDACKSIEDSYPPNAFRPKDQVSAEDLRKLTEYAKCARAHGIADFPDPDAAGTFDVTGTSLANNRVPANVKSQVDQACKSIWSGKITMTGGSGGKNGGKK
jgi:hypothetical protein